MPLVIYLGWHVFTRDASLLKPSEKAPLSLATLQENPEALEQGGTLLLETLSDSEKPLQKWLTQNPQYQITLVWPQPHTFVAACLAKGQKPELALEQWQNIAQSALTLFRSYRRQFIMLGAAPNEHLENLNSTEAINSKSFVLPSAQDFPLYQLAAEQLVKQSQQLQKILDYLSASSVACSSPVKPMTSIVSNALASIQNLKFNHNHAVKEAQKKTEQKITELTKHINILENEKIQHQKTVAALKEAEKENQKLSDQYKTDDKEKKLLINQLHNVQESLEESIQNRKADVAILKKVEQQNSTYHDALVKEKQQHQQVVVALEDVEKKNQKIKEQYLASKQEQELLILQLHTVQEDLEAAFQCREVDSSKLKKYEQQLKDQQHAWDEEKTQHQAAIKLMQNYKKKLRKAEQTTLNLTQQINQLNEDKSLRFKQLCNVQEKLEEKYLEFESKESKYNFLMQKSAADNLAHQQEVHKLKSVITWLRAHAYRHVVVAYRYSRTYKKMLPEMVKLLESSKYFDDLWYCKQYADVSKANISPAEHYIKFGAIEGRNPSAIFNAESYLASNNDIAASGQHPLLHFLRHGVFEERIIGLENTNER